MGGLLKSYGRGLVSVFFGAVLLWGLMLIILPQLAMLERAMTKPKRQLDSSIAAQLERDASLCGNILARYDVPAEPDPQTSGGLAIPSIGGSGNATSGGLAIPSIGGSTANISGGLAIPSIGGAATSTRPYILACERSTTRQQLVRLDGNTAYLNETYDAPTLSVLATDPLSKQIETAKEIETLAAELLAQLLEIEANSSQLGFSNFNAMTQPILIPLNEELKQAANSRLDKQLLGLIGLRFEVDGNVYERIGLIILTRTLFFAVMATLLALVVCYPIAYKVALATPPERAVWLFLGLIIPYAIVELMRIYAWTSIIDNRGLLNEAMMWIGIISEPIAFKRSALTVFVVIVYTYVLFMVFPIYNVMSTLDRNQIEAAQDLGASPFRLHWRVIIPHAKPGIAVGCIATFMLAAGAFSVPRIISRGLQSEWFAQTIYNKFFESENSNIGAAYSFTYTFVCFVLVALFMWIMRTRLKDFARVQ